MNFYAALDWVAEFKVLGWSWIPDNHWSWIFCPTPTPVVQLDHVSIILLNWEFLLKQDKLFWNFCCNRNFLLCTTVSSEFNSQISFPSC